MSESIESIESAESVVATRTGERDELDRLRHQLDSVAAELRSVRGELEDLQRGDGSARPEIEIPAAVTRRNWMKGAAAAAVGGTALALGSSDRVAADDPDDLTLGASKTTTGLTAGGHDGAQTNGVAFLFQSQSAFSGTNAAFPAALGGWSGNEDLPNGVYGYTNIDSGDASGVVGVAGFSSGTGVTAISEEGVGLRAAAGFIGVSAEGGEYGVSANGDIAALLLGATNTTAPPDRGITSGAAGGSLDTQRLSDSGAASLWYCTAPGAPGVWQKLAGPSTAGALHPIDPRRVYDSRAPQPATGRLASGASRVVSVADARDLATGAVTRPGLVPEGATAITYNITVANTVASGFVAVTPGSSTDFGASSINWSASGSIVANAGLVKLNLDRQVKVFCGGGGSTDFVIDVTGYYL